LALSPVEVIIVIKYLTSQLTATGSFEKLTLVERIPYYVLVHPFGLIPERRPS
jgi:hypothetical protein